MKHILTVSIIALLTCVALSAVAADAPAKVKLGVYDSRAIAIAWARTPAFAESMKQLRADFMSAKEAKDEKRAQELEQQGQWMQVRLHQRGFSTAGAADLLGELKSSLPAIAKEAGVIAIVSKWELPFSDPAVELVDVTSQVVGLFHPGEDMQQIIRELKNQPPVPFSELSLDPND